MAGAKIHVPAINVREIAAQVKTLTTVRPVIRVYATEAEAQAASVADPTGRIHIAPVGS